MFFMYLFFKCSRRLLKSATAFQKTRTFKSFSLKLFLALFNFVLFLNFRLFSSPLFSLLLQASLPEQCLVARTLEYSLFLLCLAMAGCCSALDLEEFLLIAFHLSISLELSSGSFSTRRSARSAPRHNNAQSYPPKSRSVCQGKTYALPHLLSHFARFSLQYGFEMALMASQCCVSRR